MTFTDDQITELIATTETMREQLGEDYPKVGSILDLWFRSADALAQVKAERDELNRMHRECHASRAGYIKQVENQEHNLRALLAENSALREALTSECQQMSQASIHAASAIGDSRLAMGVEMVKLGYAGLRERLYEAEAERDEARAKVRGLGFSLEGTQAENAALRDTIREALEHDPLHGASEGLHCGGMAPCIRRILSRAAEKGDAS